MNTFIQRIKKYAALIVIYVCNLLPIRNNKIFFFSYYGSQYGCNPKYITQYILEHFPADKFELVWAFNDLESKHHLGEFRKVKVMSLKYFYDLCTSKIIITNFRTTDLFVKRKEQYYIQTWHSSLRLKRIEKDAEQSLQNHYVQMAKEDSLKCDLLLSGCKYSTSIFERAFWYNGEIFEFGTPRNDIFFQDHTVMRKEILDRLNLPNECKIILYAPTFRKNNSLDVYDLDYGKISEQASKKFGSEWIFLVKLHPHLLSQSSQLRFGDKARDVTTYDDVQELMCVADMLITDYSSLMFDYSITGRPCFLYVPDAADYISQDRELYFDLHELPFISACNQEDLMDQMRNFNAVDYKTKLYMFFDRIGSYEEGNACKNLLQRIDEVCFSEKEKGGRVYEAV